MTARKISLPRHDLRRGKGEGVAYGDGGTEMELPTDRPGPPPQ